MAAKLPKPDPADQPSKKEEDKDLAREAAQALYDGVEQVQARNRRGLAEAVELNPASLCGSFFHRVENGEMVWAGVVVGEPQAGTYLLQVDSGLEGARRSKVQVILPLDKLEAKDEGYEFRFYDTEEAMKAAFAEHLLSQHED